VVKNIEIFMTENKGKNSLKGLSSYFHFVCEQWNSFLALTKSVTTRKSNDVTIIETHAVEHIAQVLSTLKWIGTIRT
jgi:hypothetical protein